MAPVAVINTTIGNLSSIIGTFEYLLESMIALAAFIPVIIGMGGNIGTQSSTIIVRGIATGRIESGSELKVMWKEVRVGIILGALYGLLLGAFAKLRFIDADPMLGVVVGLSIGCSMLLAVCYYDNDDELCDVYD